MNDQDLHEAAAHVLLRAHRDVHIPPPSSEHRAQAIALLEKRILENKSKKRTLYWTLGAVAVAATVGGAFFSMWKSHDNREANVGLLQANPPVTATLSGESGVLVDHKKVHRGALLREGSELAASNQDAQIALSTGTELLVRANSNVAIRSQNSTQHYQVSRGALRAHVAKLKGGERFLVSTSDTEVEVRGTIFEVSVLPEKCVGFGHTQVRVDEGVVVVRSGGNQVRLTAGMSWPASCGKTAALEEKPQINPVVPSGMAAKNHPSAPDSSGSAALATSLSEQNDLYAQGMEKKRRGDTAGAVQIFDKLLSKHPSTPLAEAALVEEMHMLKASSDRASTKRAAERYLGRFPHGVASDEARSILESL